MQKKEIITTVYEYENSEIAGGDAILIEKSREAAQKAYSPYSQFSVGAAILLANGSIFMGNNQENAAYPSGLCAERVAIFYANANFPTVPVVAVAVCVFTHGKFLEMPVPPCGACRQVLLETENRFKTPIKIFLAGSKKTQMIENVQSLLPITFNNDYLK